MKGPTNSTRHHCMTLMELHYRFALWMLQQKTPVTVDKVRQRFHLHRATAYRWLAAWRAANGICEKSDVR